MKILFLTPRIPYPPLKGDKIRPYNFIKELSKKHEIDLCAFYETNEELGSAIEMRKYCRNLEMIVLKKWQSYMNLLRIFIGFKPLQVNYYYSRQMIKRLKKIVKKREYDIVHIVLQRMMQYANCLDGENIVLDHIDALSLNMKRRAVIENNFFNKIIFYYEYLNMQKYERKGRGKYLSSLITSEIDKKALNDRNIKVIPNGVDTDYFKPVEVRKDIDLIFTGNMSYFPNVDAVLYFCREILPEIYKVLPKIKFYIVGVNPAREVKALDNGKNIVVTGYVEEIRSYLNRAKVFVAPLRSGSGIQNKILEAFASSLPVVSTTCGNAGIAAKNAEEIIIEDDVKKFADAVVNLLNDLKKMNNIGIKARELAIRKFSWKERAKALENIYYGIVDKR